MTLLLVALAATASGPFLYRILHERPAVMRYVDGFVYVAVPVLVAWQIFPPAWEHRSVLPIVAVVAGLLAPAALERLSHALHRYTDSVALVVGLSGLALHSLLEGAALVPTEGDVPVAFGVAVALHRVPEGLVLWWLLRPRYGLGLASAGIAALLATTLVGYELGLQVLGDIHGLSTETYQALVSGSLVHVVFHQGRRDHRHDHGDDHGH